MEKSLILEEINRINFLMNFDTNKSFEDQKVTQISEQYLFEQAKAPAAGGGGVAGGAKQLTPEQIKVAKQKIQQQATKTAQSIYGELLKALDMDGDKDLKDWDGTNEGGALAAIKKIKNKETLDALNKRIAMTKQYPNLKSWLNAEMSDFDGEYGQIWAKLESMGYAGANRNSLLAAAGNTVVGGLIKGADKAIDKLRSLTFDQIMEGFREIVTGVAGTIGTLILSVIPGGQIANALIFGALFAFDIYKFGKGDGNWFNTILDGLSMILAGVGAAMAPAKTALAGEKTAVSFFGKMAQKFPKIFAFFESVGGAIAKGANKVVSLITQGITWIGKTFPFLAKSVNFLKGMIGKVSGFLTSIEEGIKGGAKAVGKAIGKTAIAQTAKSYLTSIGNKLAGPLFSKIEERLGSEIFKTVRQDAVKEIEKTIVKQGKNATVEQSRKLVCSKMGKTYCDAFDIVATAVAVKQAGAGALKSGKDAVNKGKEAISKGSGTLNTLQRVEKGAEAMKKGTQAIEKEQKAHKEASKLYAKATNLGKPGAPNVA
jgi:hypothetical protein